MFQQKGEAVDSWLRCVGLCACVEVQCVRMVIGQQISMGGAILALG